MSLLYWITFILFCLTLLTITALPNKLKGTRPFDSWRWGGSLFVVIPIILITYNLFMNHFSNVFRVDASPIAQLSVEQINNAPNTIVLILEQNTHAYSHLHWTPRLDSVDDVDFHSPDERIDLFFGIRCVSFHPRHTEESLIIRMEFHPSKYHARSSFNESVLTQNSNGTSFRLNAPIDIRHRSRPSMSWRLYNYIIIENVVILLDERRRNHNLHDDICSIFIQWLVDEIINTGTDYTNIIAP